MPYKQKNPFNGPANFRNPKNRGTSNFNALEFQMPDLSQILNKTADGDSKTVDVTNESKTGTSDEGKVGKDTPVKSSTDITLENAKKEDDPTYKDIAAKDKQRRKELNENIREARRMQRDRKNVLDYSQRQSAKQAKEDMLDQRKFERQARRQGMSVDQALENLYTVNKMKEIEAKQKGTSMKQVNRKGAGFPMVNPATQVDHMGNPIPQPPVKGTMANGGRPMNSNILVNDPTNYQDPSKISAQANAQATKMSDIASSAGTPTPRYNPYNNEMTGMAFNKGFESLPEDVQRKIDPEGKADKAPAMMGGDDPKPMGVVSFPRPGEDPLATEKSKNPYKLNKPIPKKPGTSMFEGNKSLKQITHGMSTGGVKTVNPSSKTLVQKDEPAGDTQGQKVVEGSNTLTRTTKPAMYGDHAHTKVTKKNLKATERDDAAHMDYLKRDINYDAKHGGSKKQMLDDEKHISKLAGDLKYDTKHHGRKYDNV